MFESKVYIPIILRLPLRRDLRLPLASIHNRCRALFFLPSALHRLRILLTGDKPPRKLDEHETSNNGARIIHVGGYLVS